MEGHAHAPRDRPAVIENIPFLRGAVPSSTTITSGGTARVPARPLGEAIPLGARIFAVADAFDAMTFDRPYSRAISFETARDEIKRCVGTHFDPAVVNTFLTIPLQTFADIRHRSLNEMSAADAAAEAGAPPWATPARSWS